MDHQRMIENHRIRTLRDGIKSVEDMIGKATWVYNTGEPLTKEQQDSLQHNLGEIRDFLLWLSQQ